jgi:hypothetical protein
MTFPYTINPRESSALFRKLLWRSFNELGVFQLRKFLGTRNISRMLLLITTTWLLSALSQGVKVSTYQYYFLFLVITYTNFW